MVSGVGEQERHSIHPEIARLSRDPALEGLEVAQMCLRLDEVLHVSDGRNGVGTPEVARDRYRHLRSPHGAVRQSPTEPLEEGDVRAIAEGASDRKD